MFRTAKNQTPGTSFYLGKGNIVHCQKCIVANLHADQRDVCGASSNLKFVLFLFDMHVASKMRTDTTIEEFGPYIE